MAGKVAINGAPGAGVDGAGVIGVDVTGAGVLRGVEVDDTGVTTGTGVTGVIGTGVFFRY